MLTTDEQRAISEAVATAEKETTGEIATAIIKESDSYRDYELSGAITLSLAAALIMAFAGLSPLESILGRFFWDVPQRTLFLSAIAVVVIVGAISYRVLNLAILNRLLIPSKEMDLRVRRRALVHFMESGVANTAERTGILIFISLRERRVELIADSGISAHIAQDRWDSIVEGIVEKIGEGSLSSGIIEAVKECSTLLTEHFPRRGEAINELPNEISILER